MLELTKRENYIKSIFLPKKRSEKKQYLPEDKVNKIVSEISNIGNKLGFIGNEKSKNKKKTDKRKHKYDVWIAKEIKKDFTIADRFSDIRLIIDWASNSRANIFNYEFEGAFRQQEVWHNEMFVNYNIENIQIPDIDKERIIFRCSNKEYFFYLLTEKDLQYEAKYMSHCVSGQHYKKKIKNLESLIISLRDSKNKPHITIEIDVNSKKVLQQYGKGNSTPKKEYKKMIIEFALFASGYQNMENEKVLNFLNLNYL